MCSIKKARIAYAGPALTDGEMDVRELAPALIAFAEFVSNAGKAIGCEQNIKVMINQDTLNKGSVVPALYAFAVFVSIAGKGIGCEKNIKGI